MKFHFINVVWGQEYTDKFLNFSLPTQLSQENLLAFQRDQAVYKIYTTNSDAELIVKSPIYAVLKEVIPTEIKVFNIPLSYIQDKYKLMGKCHEHAVIEANQKNGIAVFLGPDSLWSDGSFARMREIAAKGKRVVMIAGYRTVKETILPYLSQQPYFRKNASVSISSRELVRISLNHLHPMTQSLFWDSVNFANWPSQLYWKVGSQGFIARCFHIHPLMINPHGTNMIPINSIDGDYVSSIISSYKDIYIVTDSDEILGIEFSSASHGKQTIDINTKANVEKICQWAKQSSVPHHIWSFQHKIRIHAQELNESWEKVEVASDEIASKILLNM